MLRTLGIACAAGYPPAPGPPMRPPQPSLCRSRRSTQSHAGPIPGTAEEVQARAFCFGDSVGAADNCDLRHQPKIGRVSRTHVTITSVARRC
jgi:hypothetical protein